MDIKNLTDKNLLAITAKLAGQERQLVTVILRHLAEIQRRRLFCELGCSSLFSYCTDVLKYSEAQAHQKIQAMRAMLEVPELEKKIKKGKISLTNVAQAQSFFRQEAKATKAPLPLAKKKEILKKLESASTREGQRILLSLSSQPKAPVIERERPVTPELTEVRFAANDELLAKLKKLKGLLAHKKGNMNYSELINELCEIGLNKLDPVRKAERVERRRIEKVAKKIAGSHRQNTLGDQSDRHSKVSLSDRSGRTDGTTFSDQSDQLDEAAPIDGMAPSESTTSTDKLTDNDKSFAVSESTLGDPSSSVRKRQVSASVAHGVWLRAKGACENCGSKRSLQLDHRVPFGLGGSSDAENIRLLCRSCNQRAAIGSFGLQKMAGYLNNEPRLSRS